MPRSEHRSVGMFSQGSHPSFLHWVGFAEQIVDWVDGVHLVLAAVTARTRPPPSILRMDPQPSPKKRSVASFLSICPWWSLLILSGFRSAKCDSGDLSSPWNANASACEASWTAKWKKHQLYMQALEQLERAQAKDLSKWNGKRAYDMYEPEWVCETEVRVGPEEVNVGDGPKFVCGVEALREEHDCLVYSIGSGFRFQFEEGVRKHAPNCEFHVFDGTMDLTQRALPDGLEAKRIHFHNWNLQTRSGRDAKGYPSRSLEDVLRDLDHVGKTIHIFKIDCEGCEYGVLPRLGRMVQDGALTVGQIQVEVHGTDARKIQALFQSLRRAGFMIFHKERNHWGCQGYRCVEYALASSSAAKKDFQANRCHGDRLQALQSQPKSVISRGSAISDTSLGSKILQERFAKACSVWTSSPVFSKSVAVDGVVVFKFGLSSGGLGNKFMALLYNFFLSLLLKRKFSVVGADGVDIGMFFKPHLYNWTVPEMSNATVHDYPCLSCEELGNNIKGGKTIPLHVSFTGCNTSSKYSSCDVGKALIKIIRSSPEAYFKEILKLWKSKHCFLQSMFTVTEGVFSKVPEDFLVAQYRIGFHVRWGDFYLKSIQPEALFRHKKDKRVGREKVGQCLKNMCLVGHSPNPVSLKGTEYLYAATDMPNILYGIYVGMLQSINATELSCVNNIENLGRRKSFHTGKITSDVHINDAFLSAVVDFVGLSLAHEIVAPGASSFSRQAAYFGLTKLRSKC